jgi:hypothetical protein
LICLASGLDIGSKIIAVFGPNLRGYGLT